MNEIIDRIHQLNEQAWAERNNDFQEALRMAQRAQTMLVDCREAGIIELAASLRTQAYCQEQLGRYEEALPTALNGMELANQSGDLSMIAMIDNVLGVIYWRMDDYPSALNLFLHGLELIQQKPDQELEVYLVQGLGVVYYSMGIYEEALKYFALSIEMAFPEESIGRAIGLNNTACTLIEMKRSHEALPYALKACQLYRQGQYSMSNVLHTLGAIYMDIGEIDQAILYFDEALQLAEQMGNRLSIMDSLLGICRVHQAHGELETARKKLLLVLQIAEEVGSSVSHECAAHEMLSDIYKQMGSYELALEQYEKYHAVYVRKYNEQAYRRIHNAQVLREVESIRKQADLYRTLAATDTLTGLLSRREFFEQGAKAVLRSQSRQAAVSLLMIDVDFFKSINDQYGHSVGDQVLSIIATRLKAGLRQDDLAGRYGGDEFVILLPYTGFRQGRKIAERCRRALAAEPVQIGALRLNMNISVGLAVFGPESTLSLEAMIQQADQALLSAKKSGRNTVK